MLKGDRIIQLRKLTQQHTYISLQTHEAIARLAGFSGTDHKYLGFFIQKGRLTAGELAELASLTTGAVTGLIDRFEKRGLVKRERDKMDRRKIYIVADSEKIANLLKPFYEEFQAETDKLIASFSKKDLAIIESYLSKAISLMNNTRNKLVNQ